jgi:hypothetical protein
MGGMRPAQKPRKKMETKIDFWRIESSVRADPIVPVTDVMAGRMRFDQMLAGCFQMAPPLAPKSFVVDAAAFLFTVFAPVGLAAWPIGAKALAVESNRAMAATDRMNKVRFMAVMVELSGKVMRKQEKEKVQIIIISE